MGDWTVLNPAGLSPAGRMRRSEILIFALTYAPNRLKIAGG
jgi:hypothetical protein